MITSTENINYYLVGLGNRNPANLHPDLLHVIADCSVFCGGKRHHELVKHLLPEDHIWITIQGKMQVVADELWKHSQAVVFVSGDPFFFGFGNTLKRLLPQARLYSYPYFNCLQLLSNKFQLDYSSLNTVSLHGRSWEKFDEALLGNTALIGLLTDKAHSPALIAQRMIDYGFDNYSMIIGEELDGEKEQIGQFTLAEAVNYEAADLNCVILIRQSSRPLELGISDADFVTLKGRPGMITKKEIRLATISRLELHQHSCFWDIGSCTGSIAIEAKRQYPSLQVIAIEKRPECEEILKQNIKMHHAVGVEIYINDFFELDMSAMPIPSVVFVGGHGNRLKEMLLILDEYLPNTALVAMNTVTEKSQSVFESTINSLGYDHLEMTTILLNDHNPIKIISARKP